MRMKSAGFTLIEISIVLVIIGLLAGGILKGQQMIENAKYKAWVKEIDAYKVAIYTFKDRYKYFPGDFPRAAAKLPVVGGVTAVSGNGDGIIDNPSGGNSEATNAYYHLLLAGLLAGDPVNVPRNDFGSGGWVAIPSPAGGYLSGIATDRWNSGGKLINVLMYHNIMAKNARRYDEEFDDGIANTGRILCWGGATACPGAAWPSDANTVSVFVEF